MFLDVILFLGQRHLVVAAVVVVLFKNEFVGCSRKQTPAEIIFLYLFFIFIYEWIASIMEGSVVL